MNRHPKSTADDKLPEAYRTAGHVVRAVCDGDNPTAADLIGAYDNQQDLSIVLAAALSAALPDNQQQRDAFIERFFWEDEDHNPVQMSARARAAELLLSELEDGKRHLYVRIRALALSQGLTKRDLANAARYLGVRSGNVNGKGHWYQLDRQEVQEWRSDGHEGKQRARTATK